MALAPPRSLLAMTADRNEILPLASRADPSRVASTVSSKVFTVKTAGAIRPSSTSRTSVVRGRHRGLAGADNWRIHRRKQATSMCSSYLWGHVGRQPTLGKDNRGHAIA